MSSVTSLFGRLLILATLISVRPVHADDVASPFRAIPLDSALAQAAREHKIVFIDFYTTWRGPCKRLDLTTWRDPAVIALLSQRAIALKIDAEKNADLARRYSVEVYPTLALIKPDGTLIDSLNGYQDSRTFTDNFTSALNGTTSLMRAFQEVQKAKPNDFAAQANARYNLGQQLAYKGRSAEALVQYLWCFDVGMKKAKDYGGVRISFLLADIANLAKRYPPAQAALEERRDRARDALSATQDNPEDFACINHYLGEDQVTLAYFEKLAPTSPLRPGLGEYIFDLLLADQRYSDAITAQPYSAYEEHFANFKKALTFGTPDDAESLREYMVDQASNEIEALAGAGRLDDASQLVKTTLAFDHSEKTLALVHDHLLRAGHPEIMPIPKGSNLAGLLAKETMTPVAWQKMKAPIAVSYHDKLDLHAWTPYLDSVEHRAETKQITATDADIFMLMLNGDHKQIDASFPENFSSSAGVFRGTPYQPAIADACEKLLLDSQSTDWTKAWCAEALSLFGRSKDVNYMRLLLNNPNPAIVKVVTRSIKRLGN